MLGMQAGRPRASCARRADLCRFAAPNTSFGELVVLKMIRADAEVNPSRPIGRPTTTTPAGQQQVDQVQIMPICQPLSATCRLVRSLSSVSSTEAMTAWGRPMAQMHGQAAGFVDLCASCALPFSGCSFSRLPSAWRMAEMEVRRQAREPGLGCQKHSQPARPAVCPSHCSAASDVIAWILGTGSASEDVGEPGLASCVPDLAQIAGAGVLLSWRSSWQHSLVFFSLQPRGLAGFKLTPYSMSGQMFPALGLVQGKGRGAWRCCELSPVFLNTTQQAPGHGRTACGPRAVRAATEWRACANPFSMGHALVDVEGTRFGPGCRPSAFCRATSYHRRP